MLFDVLIIPRIADGSAAYLECARIQYIRECAKPHGLWRTVRAVAAIGLRGGKEGQGDGTGKPTAEGRKRKRCTYVDFAANVFSA